jgi:hypothetical protein
MASQGASLQNYNNELVKCKYSLTSFRSSGGGVGASARGV